jgi:hypothetical protein
MFWKLRKDNQAPQKGIKKLVCFKFLPREFFFFSPRELFVLSLVLFQSCISRVLFSCT